MSPQHESFWTGRVSFDEDSFEDKSRFPDITRTIKLNLGRKGLTGGRLRIESGGIHWNAGSLLTPHGQLHGSFLLPWKIIEGVEANRMPHRLPVGGSLLISLAGSQHLYGEFLGSRRRLLEAIKRSPLGSD